MIIRSINTINSLKIGNQLKEFFADYLSGNFEVPERNSRRGVEDFKNRKVELQFMAEDLSTSKIKNRPNHLRNVPTRESPDFAFRFEYGEKDVKIYGQRDSGIEYPFGYNISTNVYRWRPEIYRSHMPNTRYATCMNETIFDNRLDFLVSNNIIKNINNSIGISNIENDDKEAILSYPGKQYWTMESSSIAEGVRNVYTVSQLMESYLKRADNEIHEKASRIAEEIMRN